MLLDKNAFRAYCLLPDTVKASYKETIEALQIGFKSIDIEELRGFEFHQLRQVNQSTEQLGIEVGKFPGLVGIDLDRLLKDGSSRHFFQSGKKS